MQTTATPLRRVVSLDTSFRVQVERAFGQDFDVEGAVRAPLLHASTQLAILESATRVVAHP